ncbi:MAG: Tyrosine recombinase XerD [Candidatus Woesebacteria bacterium GW2011_GWB1_38_5b]|uniref:Tyrosine recombinase XerD n=1 Tax=Candidatus Woesebacteria bacterium GW2011_GWB1_38_5b TaxID=1618569 RepID=A0A0G0NFH6_9BACT|nr:MAG: Tyrosine recombinase XerD [Candidatus Woesebacteria bacterium GW2011_GWB1_38_5b]
MPAKAQSPAPNGEIAKKSVEFLEYLEVERGSSPLTIRNYRHYLDRFLLWAEIEGKISLLKQIDSDKLRRFRIHLTKVADEKGHLLLGKRTQGYHIIALRSFLKWLVKTDHEVIAPEKLDIPKVDERQVKFLSGEQVDRLLNAPNLSTVQGKRDKAILEVLFSTGLRVSELIKLDRDKIDLDRREFGIIGKGGRARVVFLSYRAAEWIKHYLALREDKYKPLFIRHKGKVDITHEKVRLTPRSVQRMVKKYVKKIKLPVEATPHVLRHSFATDLLMAGADLRSVQEMLGHKNVSTTQIYTHVTNRQLRDIHQKFHSKGN